VKGVEEGGEAESGEDMSMSEEADAWQMEGLE
jgi:hypothetical protein